MNGNSDELEDWGLDLPDIFEADPEAEEDNYEEPDDLKVDVVLGDLIEIGNHRRCFVVIVRIQIRLQNLWMAKRRIFFLLILLTMLLLMVGAVNLM